jgi:hypothetical protein
MPLICSLVGALAVTGKDIMEIEKTVKNISKDKDSRKHSFTRLIIK